MRGSGLGNVTGALLPGHGEGAHEPKSEPSFTRVARLLEAVFEEVLLVGREPASAGPGRAVALPGGPTCPLRSLIAALEAASSERVIVVTPELSPPRPDLLLALTAWPEQEAVMPGDASLDHPYCAIYLRDRVLGIAREQAAKGELSLEVLHGRIETARVSFGELGLDDFGSQGPMDAEVSHRSARVEDC